MTPTPCPACGDPVEGAEYCELHDPGLRVGLQVIDLRAADTPLSLPPIPQPTRLETYGSLAVLIFFLGLPFIFGGA